MKKIILGMVLLSVAPSVLSTVIELEKATAKNVLEVFEQMREEEVGSENQWIHEFETESIGREMEHLSTLKGTEQKNTLGSKK